LGGVEGDGGWKWKGGPKDGQPDGEEAKDPASKSQGSTRSVSQAKSRSRFAPHRNYLE